MFPAQAITKALIILLILIQAGCAKLAPPPQKPVPLAQEKSGGTLLVKESVVDILSEQRENSQRLTQVLLGMSVEMLSNREGWYQVKAPDGTMGWVPKDTLGWSSLTNGARVLVETPVAAVLRYPDPISSVLSKAYKGSQLPLVEASGGLLRVKLPTGISGWLPEAKVKILPTAKIPRGDARGIVAAAKDYLHSPYLLGGITVEGIDSSGLAYLAHYCNGIPIPRNSMDQFASGKPIGHSEQLQPGDLVFFSLSRPGASHVGIFLGEDRFIHAAPGKGVTIAALTDSQYKQHYLGARRYW